HEDTDLGREFEIRERVADRDGVLTREPSALAVDRNGEALRHAARDEVVRACSAFRYAHVLTVQSSVVMKGQPPEAVPGERRVRFLGVDLAAEQVRALAPSRPRRVMFEQPREALQKQLDGSD